MCQVLQQLFDDQTDKTATADAFNCDGDASVKAVPEFVLGADDSSSPWAFDAEKGLTHT